MKRNLISHDSLSTYYVTSTMLYDVCYTKIMKRCQTAIYSGEGCALHKGPWRRWPRAEIHLVLCSHMSMGIMILEGMAVSNSPEGNVVSALPWHYPPGMSKH